MSLVHNVVLTVGVADWGDYDDDNNKGGAGVQRLNAWIDNDAASAGQLAEISGHTVGPKACEIEIWAAGINYLSIEGFLQEFYKIEWEDASEVVLVIAPQSGSYEVYRPKGALEFQRPYEKCVTCERYVYEHDRRNNGHNCVSCEPDYED